MIDAILICCLLQSIVVDSALPERVFIIMSVKVAVRVRPFNQRQKFLGCICCVEMKEGTTELYQNREKNKKQHYFTFDYSFWSHDQFEMRADGYMCPLSPKYVDQERLYNVIGKEILENAWQGYNCCLFAYGQTGAGKSYSMLGYGVNRGIIPMACEEIFYKMRKHEQKGVKEYEITLSMLEIYNEKVQDLFVPTSKRPQNGLKIRENKTLGVYVEGLTKYEVTSYAEIERRMDEGNRHRSLASTLMNQYSSRAHTIVMMEFIQKEWINKAKINKKSSYINLVDLAGSQRVSKTGIVDNKDRLKEASNINKSLHTLGRVIETLADQASGRSKIALVPYRDSALTRILEGALGGNSKTIMICAISPANDNYEETLSTLRYADQTKKIKNKPIINESAVDKIIRELREENERLKKILESSEENSLASSRVCTESEKKEMRSNLRASMREVQKEIKKNLKSFAINTDEVDEEESLMMTEFIDLEEPSQFFSQLSFDWGNKAQVYITNLNEDELLNFKVKYSCQKDLLITNKNNKKSSKGMENFAKIVLCGLGIEENHAKIVKSGDRYFIQALSDSASEYTLVNGKPVYEKRELQHNDRIILGINAIFIFKNMLKKSQEQGPKLDYEFAINERQMEMENLSLIPPSTLNLFLPTSLLKDSRSRDIYGGPPTQALNATKKLLAPPQNETDVMNKIDEIEKEFNKLVKENEIKLKEKEEFYKGKLHELKKQKELEREEKNTLSEKLMQKSLESEVLKSKNAELSQLKKKLSKYYDEKERRSKARESFLLDSEDNRIEEDIEYVDVQSPQQREPNQYRIGSYEEQYKKKQDTKMAKPIKKPLYQELVIQEYENNQDLLKSSLGPGERPESLLITDIVEEVYDSNKKRKSQWQKEEKLKEQIMRNQLELMKMEDLLKKALKLQFRRLYNIKILSEVERQFICESCSQKLPDFGPKEEQSPRRLASLLGIQSLAEFQEFPDAELQQFHFKNPQQKKKDRIKEEELAKLEQQLRDIQSKLIAREARLSMASEKSQDDMLLNYSIDNPLTQRSDFNPLETVANRRSSFSIRKCSADSGFQLNLTQQAKSTELKKVVSQFIQILADLPQLNIVKTSNLVIQPIKKSLSIKRSLDFDFTPQERPKFLEFIKIEEISFTFFPEQHNSDQIGRKESEEILIQQQAEEKLSQHQIFTNEIGINTDFSSQFDSLQEKLKGTSFTAFINEEMDHSNQNQTQFLNDSKERPQKEIVEYGTNTDKQESSMTEQEEKIQILKTSFGFSTEKRQFNDFEMVTDINLQTWQEFSRENEEQYEVAKMNEEKKDDQNDEEQIEEYLQSQRQLPEKIKIEMHDMETSTMQVPSQSTQVNTVWPNLFMCSVIDLKVEIQEPQLEAEEQIQQYVKEREEEEEIEEYFENNIETQKQYAQIAINTEYKLEIAPNQVDFRLEKEDQQRSIKKFVLSSSHSIVINHSESDNMALSSLSVDICIFPQKLEEDAKSKEKEEMIVPDIQHLQRDKPEMIDEEVQINSELIKREFQQQMEEQRKNDNSVDEKQIRRKNKLTTIENHFRDIGNSNDLADKFNLSVSDIEKHELSYQDVSVFGFDGLLKEDQLNSKIKQLEDKIIELESQAQNSGKEISSSAQMEPKQQKQFSLQTEEVQKQVKKPEEGEKKRSPPLKKTLKKKKKKHQMTEQQRKEYQIQKQLEAKIIQCNNQNIINQRNLQIHKRKREADELRKILIKKEKVELQKQLLVLIPMVRRFNLIAREMKRLIEGKISIEYRNFSHYQMVEILKSYSINKKSNGDNIQINIIIMNVEEVRIYTWPIEVFQNRYQIAQQIFQQYVAVQDDEIGRNRMLLDRTEKSKDPFWDPVDFVHQGNGYLSMEFLLYNISYEGYISIVYKSAIIAKLYVSLIPVKIKKFHDEEEENQNSYEESCEQNIQIGNQRNLLEKDIYFTISIESIKFMKAQERHKADESNHSINIDSLNSNILKYSISYELLENQYKLTQFTTPQVDFVEEKQFKRIDYMRRHSFKNISESTIGYISDCPIKFTLNVMKDYSDECLNASFNEQLSDSDPASSELDNSLYSDSKSMVSKKSSVNLQDLPKELQPKTDFSKKPKTNMIYENTQMISKLQTEAKIEQDRIDKARKIEEAKRKASRYDRQKGKDKDKDKDCVIY